MKIRRMLAALALALPIVAPTLAFAQNEVKDPKDLRNKFLRHERRELRGGDAGQEGREEMRKARKAARLAELKKRFGDAIAHPAVREEMRTNAMRMARLHRIEHLARAEKKEALMKRVDAAIDREKARHEKKMDQLRTSVGDAGAPAAVKPSTDGGAK